MFFHDETGGELAEYSVLILFVVLCSVALFTSTSDSLSGIWLQLASLIQDAKASVHGR
ncbi:MAG TPA: hypothetical protein VGJ09_13280 [Bryobacteraceae bacterium]|jgi:Flp pilus assembly pilin Flp